MAFLTNAGPFTVNPYPLTESYLQLAHPLVADVLLLQQMPQNGDGYSPPSLTGLAVSKGRANNASLIVIEAPVKKLEWADLAFVCTPAQAALFTSLVSTQSGAQPCTVVDNMQKLAVTKLVLIEVAGKYITPYAGLRQVLVQFSLREV